MSVAGEALSGVSGKPLEVSSKALPSSIDRHLFPIGRQLLALGKSAIMSRMLCDPLSHAVEHAQQQPIIKWKQHIHHLAQAGPDVL